MGKRRGKGEGGVFQLCDSTCPPKGPGGERPRHRCGKPWRAQIDLGWVGGRRLRPTATRKTKPEALQALKDLQAKADQGVVPQRSTVTQWLDYWMEHADLKPTTRAGYQSYLDNWITPHLGKIELQKLQPAHIRALHAAMRDKGLSETSVRQCHAILKRALTVAVQDQRVTRNVAKAVTPPKVERNPHGILTIEDAQRVLAAAGDPRTKARLAVALMVGLRQGEALGLTWECVHLDADIPHVEIAQTIEWVDGEPVAGTPKSDASRRRTPLTPGVVQIMEDYREKTSGAGLVFQSPAGGEVHQRADWQLWTDTLKRAGVEHVPLHGARGTAATYLIEQGFNIVAVAQFLGHADPSVTMRHYLHVSKKMQMKTMGALDAMLELPNS